MPDMMDYDSHSMSEDSEADEDVMLQRQHRNDCGGESPRPDGEDAGRLQCNSNVTAEEREALRKARRRKNNRDSARRVRARKMEEFAELQEQVKAAVTLHKELNSTCVKLQRDKQQLESKKLLMEVEHQILASTNTALREHVAAVTGHPPATSAAVNAKSTNIYAEARCIALALLENEEPLKEGRARGAGPSKLPGAPGASSAPSSAPAAGPAAPAAAARLPPGQQEPRRELVLDLRGSAQQGGAGAEAPMLSLWQQPAATARERGGMAGMPQLSGQAPAASEPQPLALHSGAPSLRLPQRSQGSGSGLALQGRAGGLLQQGDLDPAGLLLGRAGSSGGGSSRYEQQQHQQHQQHVAYSLSQYSTDGMYGTLEQVPSVAHQQPSALPGGLWSHLQPVELYPLAAEDYAPQLEHHGAVRHSLQHVAYAGPVHMGEPLLRLSAEPSQHLRQHGAAGRPQQAMPVLHPQGSLHHMHIEGGPRPGFLGGGSADRGHGGGMSMLHDTLDDRRLPSSAVLHLPQTRSHQYARSLVLPSQEHSSFALAASHFQAPSSSALHLGSSHDGAVRAPHTFMSQDMGL